MAKSAPISPRSKTQSYSRREKASGVYVWNVCGSVLFQLLRPESNTLSLYQLQEWNAAWRKNWLSGLWNILFLISSESTERERSLDFGTLTPVTCRSSWEWLQFISQVGESWVIGGRTRGKLNSSCAETGKARFIQLQRTCSKSPAKVKDSEERRAAQVWRRLLRSDNNLF